MTTANQIEKMTREQIIERCRFELVTNFDCPSKRILGVFGAKLGLNWQQMQDLLWETREQK